jgi:hypothetical protein
MKFVMEEVALRYVFLPMFPFCPVSVDCTVLHSHLRLTAAEKGKLGTFKRSDAVSNIGESI